MSRRVFTYIPRGSGHERGFTLLELVMVMTIIVILAAVSVSSYRQIQTKAKETILRENLKSLRKLIDQYEGDQEELPQSLDDLVSKDYLREIPIDPITGEPDWVPVQGQSKIAREGKAESGIADVKSNAPGTGSDGVAYSEY